MLTEAIIFSTKVLRSPLWCLFVDKQAAFDMVMKQHILPAALSAAGGPGHADKSLVYLANRLSNRRTFFEFDSVLMGPILDSVGAEQGGILSSDEFQLVNSEELKVTNDSLLGLDMGGVHVASIGAADDVVLVSPSPHGLQGLLNLSSHFCIQKSLINVQGKTRLVVFEPSNFSPSIPYNCSELVMDGKPLSFSSEAGWLNKDPIKALIRKQLVLFQPRFLPY